MWIRVYTYPVSSISPKNMDYARPLRRAFFLARTHDPNGGRGTRPPADRLLNFEECQSGVYPNLKSLDTESRQAVAVRMAIRIHRASRRQQVFLGAGEAIAGTEHEVHRIVLVKPVLGVVLRGKVRRPPLHGRKG